uniref:Uncharacterized protein n=1 Tax=Panagrolaimus davidi TaxID=227884 RepID=A0A914Q4M0_9BILA
MTFFDSTPLNRILNRLSKDIEKVDNDVPHRLSYSATLIGECVFYLISAMYFIPQIGFLSIIVMIFFVFTTLYYTYASVQIRRLFSAASAVASHLQDSYVGIITIRAFSVQGCFSNQMMKKETTAIESELAKHVSNKWIELRMSILTSIFTTILTAFAIYFGHIGYITAAAVGLVTSTGTMLRNLLGSIAQTVKDMEMSIVAVERVQEYVDNEHEAAWISTIWPPSNWPSRGKIIFKGFSLRYRASTPLVLKGLNLEIKGRENVGVVGRTGAGKTSFPMALFRMTEPSEGTILIDSNDYRSLELHDLRKALTIIPQDPVLFCGNLRINLDPFEEFTYFELWEAIEKAHLKKFVDEFLENLNHKISEGGGNFSVGQRQLICLAPAILRKKTKILILDEATAYVDAETDSLIQESIRNQFPNCTILTIAHRLNTIMDYDKILVMDSGEIQKFDAPKNLLSNKNGLFYSLAEQAKLLQNNLFLFEINSLNLK